MTNRSGNLPLGHFPAENTANLQQIPLASLESHLPGNKPRPDAAARLSMGIHLFRLLYQVEDQITSRASGEISSVLAPTWVHFVILFATCFVRGARRWAAAGPPSRERLVAF